jgi:hypothetical protein
MQRSKSDWLMPPCSRLLVARNCCGLGGNHNADVLDRGPWRRNGWLRNPARSNSPGCQGANGGHVEGAGLDLHGTASEQSDGRSNRSVELQLGRRNDVRQRVDLGRVLEPVLPDQSQQCAFAVDACVKQR